MDYSTIGKQIRKYRRIRNLSQEQLAEKIDISTTHMSHIETGSTKLSLPVLVKISETLNVAVDDILFEQRNSFVPTSFSFLESCTPEEREIILEIIKSAKNVLSLFSIKHNEF